MGKKRYQKQLKYEKTKVKLKNKRLNNTDTDFKIKKIIMCEQLQQQNRTQILSRRKLNVKDLLTRMQHYNTSVKQNAVRELKEILSQYKLNMLNVQLNELIKGISALLLDKEKYIRRESLQALSFILNAVSKEQLIPFYNIFISYLICTMTHIDKNIMEDSILFLDILSQHCNRLVINNRYKILLYFSDMILKFHVQVQPGRHLTSNLNFKSTSMKWKIKFLNSLQNFMLSLLYYKKQETVSSLYYSSKIYHVANKTQIFQTYLSNRLQVCPIHFEKINSYSRSKNSIDLNSLQNYIDSLMPLLFDCWFEVHPKKHSTINIQIPISSEEVSLLKCITNIINCIIEYITIFEKEEGTSLISIWYKDKYKSTFLKNIFQDFPYSQQKFGFRVKKSQEEKVNYLKNYAEDCLNQNLSLCYIYIWYTSKCNNLNIDKLDTYFSSLILQFITDKIDNWTNNQIFAVPYLIKVLRAILIENYMIWYKNEMPLGNVLKSVINAYFRQTQNDLQTQLLTLLTDIAMDRNLEYLHSEDIFKQFIKSLPSLLLKEHINYTTIQLLNKIVLQYRQLIEQELIKIHDSVIKNAKSIQIVGTDDEWSSRLMICNLFYFVNEDIYY